MAKKKRQLKRRSARSVGSKKRKRKKSAKPKLTLKQRLARAKKLEALDAGKPVFEVSRERALESQTQTRGAPLAVISGSVGRWEKNASNLPEDVKTVQRLLETAAQKLQAPALDPKGVDGLIARPPRNSNTVNAIEAFQSRFNLSIDGLIEPGGQTWQALLQAGSPPADSSHPFRNDDFPQTYIQQISVSLDDPDHSLTLTWTGPKADSQETGPFRTSPGAGLKGLNCDDDATSRRSGSKCTPKGTRPVQGFQRRLNSDSRATYVTWFMQSRGIALHYFPIVPEYAASHGCVRLESVNVARLIQDNSIVDDTQVVVSGTWTKPRKQWD
jgi:peptidoglycan hydrolase-like protein with peptidoglycan-binding domain